MVRTAVPFFAYNWGYSTIDICLPLYMYDVLGFNMTKNGMFLHFRSCRRLLRLQSTA